MAMRVKGAISSMNLPVLKEESLKDLLKNLKSNKAAGPDKIKGEFFKELGKDKMCRKTMVRCYNNVLKEERAPPLWENQPQRR